jgi:hypothetical protein
MKLNNIPLALYKSIVTYSPKLGDFIIWHGLWGRYYAIINGVSNDTISAIKSGMPNLLFTMAQEEMDKSLIKINLTKIRRSRGGYAILQNGTWYI